MYNMNTFYHFGDSYSICQKVLINSKHFGEIIADKIEFKYKTFGKGGMPNEWVFKRVMENIYEFQIGDILFINFSFFERGLYYNPNIKTIESTAWLYNDIKKNFRQNYFNLTIKDREKLEPIVNYYLNDTEDYNRRIFDLFNILLKQIYEKGVKIFYIYAGSSDYEDELLNIGTNIKFPNGFSKWLLDNNLHNEEDIHFTLGIQPLLADMIYKKTNELKNTSKTIFITNDDFDFSKINNSVRLI